MKDELVELMNQHVAVFIAAAIILFGAMANAASMVSRAQSKRKKYTLIDFFVGLVISGFSGMMFGFASQFVTTNEYALYLSSGTGAYLGLAGINKFSDGVMRKDMTNILLGALLSVLEKMAKGGGR